MSQTPRKTPKHAANDAAKHSEPAPARTPFEIIKDFFTTTPKHRLLNTTTPKHQPNNNNISVAAMTQKQTNVKEITNPIQKQNLIKELNNPKVNSVQDFFNPTPKHVPIRVNASSIQTPKHLNKSLMSFAGTGKPQSNNLSYNGTMKSIKQH